MLCRSKMCPLSLAFRSFYDKTLAEDYVKKGHGIGFLIFFALALLSAVVYGILSLFMMMTFDPEMIEDKIVNFPTIEIQDGEIVQPKDFFQRFAIGDGIHLVLDTSSDAHDLKHPSSHEIYISKNGVQFVKGNKVELMPLTKLFGSDNAVITAQTVSEFIAKRTKEMMFAVPLFVFAIALPLLFLKYVICAYCFALVSYLATFCLKRKIHFETRMRLASISVLPVFVFNFFFATLFGLFSIHAMIALIITFAYLFFHLHNLEEEVELEN